MDNINTFEASKFKGKLSKSENEEIDVIYERILQNTTQHSDGEGDHCQRVSKKDTKNRHRNPARNRYGHSKLLSNAGIAYAKQHKKVPSKYDHKLKNQLMVHICADPIKMSKNGGSKCINHAHIMLKSPQYNNAQKPCHNYIRKYERKYRYKTAISVTAKVTVAVINKIANHEATHECPHTAEYPCFVIFDPQ